jgi:stage V sporulation protein G
MNKGEWGKIKAFFDVKTEEGFVIKGFKLVQGINGLFVGNPSQKGNDNEYYDTIYADKELKEELSQIAIDHYGQEVMPSEEPFSSSPPPDDSFAKEAPAEPSNVENSETPTFTDDDIPF